VQRIPLTEGKTNAVMQVAQQAGLPEVDGYAENLDAMLATTADLWPERPNAQVKLQTSGSVAGVAVKTHFEKTSHEPEQPDHRTCRPQDFPEHPGTENSPAFEVLEVPSGYLMQIDHAPVVLTPTLDRIVSDFSSRYAGLVHAYDFDMRRVLADARTIEGAALVLCDNVQPINYAHWLLDELPRLAFLGENRDLHVVVAARMVPFQIETLRLCGFAPERIVTLKDFGAVQARRLLVSRDVRAMPHPAFKAAGWAVRFLRDRILPGGDSEPGTRLYISRADSAGRYVVNEEELMAVLGPLGYRRVTLAERSVADQATLFAGASHIVGLHGSGFANLVFARRGAQIIEIFARTYGTPAFYVIAAAVGCRYATYVAEEVIGGKRTQVDDVRIDVTNFEKACKHLL